MILQEKHIDSTIPCGLYGCVDEESRFVVNCYNSSEYDIGLKFSKVIDNFTGKQSIGIRYNSVTFEELSPYPIGQERCGINSDTLYIFSNEWDMFTVQQVKPLMYNTIAIVNRLDDYRAITNAYDFIHRFKTVVLVSTIKARTWLYEANKRIKTDNTEVKTVNMGYLGDTKCINEYFIKNGEEKTSVMLANMLTELTSIGVPGVTDISTVKPESKAHVKRYFTMIDKVDSKTGGMSGFWLITGQTGNGKSELAMQLSLAVVEQGGKVFYYSGEEKKERFINKLAIKVVDSKSIIKEPRELYGGRHSEDDFDYYVENNSMQQFEKWLANKYYIYDEVFKDENIINKIIEMMEEMHKMNGITAFFLDNLMTLTTGIKQAELYQMQTELTDRLKDFSNDYNVLVVLVAHPNKSSDTEIKNKDISGSLNVANLTHVIITVRRATRDEMDKDIQKNIEPRNSYISCTKNRPKGDLFKTGVYFDTVNKIFIQGKRPEFNWSGKKQEKTYFQEEFPF